MNKRPSSAALRVQSPDGDHSGAGLLVKVEGLSTVFTFNDLVYKVSGAKEGFVTSLKVNIKAEKSNPAYQEERYFDTIDLYLSRARSSFALQVFRLFGVEPKRVEKDLITILEYFEKERDKKLVEEDEEKAPVLTIEEENEGLKFLRNPGLLQEIVSDMEKAGYVGEERNKLLLYLCASSRVLDDPISVLIISESASGKSFMVDIVEKLMPPEGVMSVTSLSDQALNYVSGMRHKFLVLGEAVHSDVIEYQIREMLSRKELSRLVTVKDEKTGKMSVKLVKTPVIVSSVMSSTRRDINPENASRCFVINTDESREQTGRIHKAQNLKYSLVRYYDKQKVLPEIMRKHHAAQRLLKKTVIVNPFGGYIDFPSNLMRTRRDNDRFMDLIACVCFLRQYQKERRFDNGLEYIECDIEDYKAAYDIMVNGVLASSLLEMPKSAVELYNSLLSMAREIAKKSGIKATDAGFTQRDIRDNTGFGQCWIKHNLRVLVDFEYINLVRGGSERSKGFYRLKEDKEMGKLNLSMIPTPEEIEKRLKAKTG